MIDLAYIVVNNLPLFRSDVRWWLRRAPVDQTWTHIQDHLTNVHQELRKADASVDEVVFQLTNIIFSQIFDQLQKETSGTTVHQTTRNHRNLLKIPHLRCILPFFNLDRSDGTDDGDDVMNMETMRQQLQSLPPSNNDNRNYNNNRYHVGRGYY